MKNKMLKIVKTIKDEHDRQRVRIEYLETLIANNTIRWIGPQPLNEAQAGEGE